MNTTATRLFAASGNFFGDVDPPGKLGLFRHEIGSAGWIHVLRDIPVYAVQVDPHDPDRVIAGTRDGLYFSTDGGNSFEKASCRQPQRAIWSLLADPLTPACWYAGGSPASIYRSLDHGASWDLIAEPAIPDRARMPFAPRVMRMAVHPERASDLYATLEIAGVIRSTDGGFTWSDCSAPLIALSDADPRLQSRIVCDMGAEGMLDGHAICTSSTHPDRVLLACRMGVFESDDGGGHWTDLRLGRFSEFNYARDIRVSPQDPSTLYACMSVASASKNGALMRSVDFGATWTRFDKIQPHGTLMAVSLHPRDSEQVFIAARYGEVFGTLDGGASWEEIPLPPIQHVYGLSCG